MSPLSAPNLFFYFVYVYVRVCICVSTVYVGACVFNYVRYILVGVALYFERQEDGLGWLQVSSSFTLSCCFEAESPPEPEAHSLFFPHLD